MFIRCVSDNCTTAVGCALRSNQLLWLESLEARLLLTMHGNSLVAGQLQHSTLRHPLTTTALLAQSPELITRTSRPLPATLHLIPPLFAFRIQVISLQIPPPRCRNTHCPTSRCVGFFSPMTTASLNMAAIFRPSSQPFPTVIANHPIWCSRSTMSCGR